MSGNRALTVITTDRLPGASLAGVWGGGRWALKKKIWAHGGGSDRGAARHWLRIGCVSVRACVRACVQVCGCACVHACVREREREQQLQVQVGLQWWQWWQ